MKTKLVFESFIGNNLKDLITCVNEFVNKNNIASYNEFQYSRQDDFYVAVLSYYKQEKE